MAKPFGENAKENSDDPKKENKESNCKSKAADKDKTSTSELKFTSKDGPTTSSDSEHKGSNSTTNIYCISNSSNLNCGPTYINVTNKKYVKKHSSQRQKSPPNGRYIKIKVGVLDSTRKITNNDAKIVAEKIGQDWKILAKNLPNKLGETNNFHGEVFQDIEFEQKEAFVEHANKILQEWALMHPEAATIGNLARTLYNIHHPEILSFLDK